METVSDLESTPRVVIRHATESELDLLADVERDAAELFRSIGYDFCAEGPTRTAEEKLWALREGAVLVAVAGDSPVGFALLVPVDGAAHLLELAVARPHQGRGLGRALLARAEAWASGAGYREMTLTTFRDVPWNAPYYRRAGYQDLTPKHARPGLLAIQAEEAACGFAARPRIAMHKILPTQATNC